MNRANAVDCHTSVATYHQELTGRITNTQINQTDSQEPGSPKLYKVIILLLAFLFGILLTGLIVVMFKYRKDTVQLKANYERCIDDQDYLNRCYYNLTIERDQLLASKQVQIQKAQSLEKLLPFGCVTGWSNFSSHLYCASAMMLSWNESRHSCAEIGAYLVIINSPDEQEFVTKLQMSHVWIGLTRNATEGVWKWLDNTELILEYWMAEKPYSLDGSEVCGEIRPDTPSLENWKYIQCKDFKHYYICEYEY